MMKNNPFLILLLLLFMLTGCNDKVGLRGKVVFSDDGSPVPVGTVCLVTDSYFSRGELQSDGTFIVGSLKPKDGIPPGSYRVYISGAERVIGYTKNGDPIFESLIDEKYGNQDTSGLSLDIRQSTKDFTIKVDRFVKE